MVTFRDIAGVDVACQELLEVVACLRDSDRYSALNAKVPSGVLLCGPPGTGKTLLGELGPMKAGLEQLQGASVSRVCQTYLDILQWWVCCMWAVGCEAMLTLLQPRCIPA